MSVLPEGCVFFRFAALFMSDANGHIQSSRNKMRKGIRNLGFGNREKEYLFFSVAQFLT